MFELFKFGEELAWIGVAGVCLIISATVSPISVGIWLLDWPKNAIPTIDPIAS